MALEHKLSLTAQQIDDRLKSIGNANELETGSKQIVAAINEVAGKTVDNVKSIDTYFGGVSELGTNDGITWTDRFKFTDKEGGQGSSIAQGKIYHHLPLTAGNNIEFELDTENQVVAISTSGINADDIAHLQPKEDANLETDSKEIVGAINELNDKLIASSDPLLGVWEFSESLNWSSIFFRRRVQMRFRVQIPSGALQEFNYFCFGEDVDDFAINYESDGTAEWANVFLDGAWTAPGNVIDILEAPTDQEFIEWMLTYATKRSLTNADKSYINELIATKAVTLTGTQDVGGRKNFTSRMQTKDVYIGGYFDAEDKWSKTDENGNSGNSRKLTVSGTTTLHGPVNIKSTLTTSNATLNGNVTVGGKLYLKDDMHGNSHDIQDVNSITTNSKITVGDELLIRPNSNRSDYVKVQDALNEVTGYNFKNRVQVRGKQVVAANPAAANSFESGFVTALDLLESDPSIAIIDIASGGTLAQADFGIFADTTIMGSKKGKANLIFDFSTTTETEITLFTVSASNVTFGLKDVILTVLAPDNVQVTLVKPLDETIVDWSFNLDGYEYNGSQSVYCNVEQTRKVSITNSKLDSHFFEGETADLWCYNNTYIQHAPDFERVINLNSEVKDFLRGNVIINGSSVLTEESSVDALETTNKTVVGAINELDSIAIDKIGYFDTYYDDNSSVSVHTTGISWNNRGLIESPEGDSIVDNFEILQRIPVVAGENVTFEVDEENQVVKINATGGGDAPSVSLIGRWTIIDNPEIPTRILPLKFTSNDFTYTQIGWGTTGSSSWGIYNLRYQNDDDASDAIVYTNNPSGNYGITHGWNNEAYKTISILEEPDDPDTIAWLGANTNVPKVAPSLPSCDSSNEGQFLRVVGGVPTWASIPNAEDNSF